MFFINSCKENSTAASSNLKTGMTQPKPDNNLKLVSNLSSALNETSGLIYYKSMLFTHNDKGSSNQIYIIDTATGTINNMVVLSNALSVDYEDIAQSAEYIYVGDIGNKHGDRKDLCIYKIKKTDLDLSTDTIRVTTTKIAFTYPDQKIFTKSKEHNFDCEAIIYFKENLYLFTKNRLDKKCNLYVIPDKEGNNEAKYIGSFNTNGLITGADISNDGNTVVLSGYNKKENAFIWIFSGFNKDNFFNGNAQQIILGPYNTVGQTEGVCFSNFYSLYISAEKTDDMPAKLYSLKL